MARPRLTSGNRFLVWLLVALMASAAASCVSLGADSDVPATRPQELRSYQGAGAALFDLVPVEMKKDFSEEQEAQVRRFLDEITSDACFDQNTDSESRIPIPGELITWLLANPEAGELLPPAGFLICGAEIAGDLIQPVPRTVLPLYLNGCSFQGSPRTIVEGHFAKLSLVGSHFEGGLTITESIIEGLLDLRGIDFTTAPETPGEGYGLEIRATDIGGDLDMSWLSIVFTDADAEPALVRFIDVSIDGDVTAHSCRLQNPRGGALLARRLHVGGDVLLDSAFDPASRIVTHNREGRSEASALSTDRFEAQGSIVINDSAIDGSLILDDIVLSASSEEMTSLRLKDTPVGCSLRMENLHVEGAVDLAGVVVRDILILDSTFERARLSQVARSLPQQATPSKAHPLGPSGGVSVERASIGGRLVIRDCYFDGVSLLLNEARITDSVSLGPALGLRQGFLGFDKAIVGGSVTIEGCQFGGRGEGAAADAVSLRNTHVRGDLALGNTESAASTTSYDGIVTLVGSRIDGSLHIEGIRWEDGSHLVLANASVGCLVGVPSEPRPPSLSADAVASKTYEGSETLPTDWDNWPDRGHLDLNGFIYASAHLDPPLNLDTLVEALSTWLQLNRPKATSKVAETKGETKDTKGSVSDQTERKPFDRAETTDPAWSPFPHQSYHQLARVLEASGQPEAARRISIQRYRDHRDFGGIGWSESVGSFLFGALSGFGYIPLRVVPWIFVTVVLWAIVFWIAHRKGLIVLAEKPDPNRPRKRFNALMYSIDVFLPIVDFRQAGHWLPGAESGTTGKKLAWIPVLRAWLWLSTALGWIFTTLLVAGLTGLLRT